MCFALHKKVCDAREKKINQSYSLQLPPSTNYTAYKPRASGQTRRLAELSVVFLGNWLWCHFGDNFFPILVILICRRR